ncbi:MAG: ABC transporter substrate-binding protein [Acidimicrobiia bacterium]|nr:ABC transporter substrate-binding protein [Acidimicrobiia bacterium]MYJ61827.1 ABC transporter substrate-binding protein [Acidimicrobiia bacterium]
MRRWILALLLALALVAAACGGNDDDGSAGDAPPAIAEEAEPEAPAPQAAEPEATEPEEVEQVEPEPEDAEPQAAEPEDTGPEEAAPEETAPEEPEPVVLTASYRGVTETEIKIGVGFVDVTEFGIDNGDHEAQWQAAIDRANDAGGVNGRLLVPVFGEYSPVDDAAIEGVCVRFVEDEEVFAFVGFVLWDGVLCYTELYGALAVNTAEMAPDVIGRSGGLLFTTQGGFIERINSLITAAAADGQIEGKRIQIHASAAEDEILLEPVKELVEAAGGTVTRTLVTTTPPGDVPAGEAQADVWIERAEADDVDVILTFNGGYGTVGAVERAGSDLVVVTDGVAPSAYVEFGYDPGQVNLYAYGVPTLQDYYNAGEAGVPECVENYEARSGNTVNVNVPNPRPNNLPPTIRSCRGIELFVAIATAAGPVLTQESFIEAARGLGSFDLTGTTSASLEDGKYSADNAPLVRLFWDSEISEFVSGN